MGCVGSKDSRRDLDTVIKNERSEWRYQTADPDLGWRRDHDDGDYPKVSFTVSFQNQRSGNILKKLDLVILSLNIATRAAKLANKYGVADKGTIQSSANLLEDLGDEDWRKEVEGDMRQILKEFGCPNYGWRLLDRLIDTSAVLAKYPDIFLTNGLESSENVPKYLQKVRNRDGQIFILDVAEMAINIAEQLFRLEKSECLGYRVPNDLFGWKILSCEFNEATVIVGSPNDGQAFQLKPEELIMNITTWVQLTYLTAPAF